MVGHAVDRAPDRVPLALAGGRGRTRRARWAPGRAGGPAPPPPGRSWRRPTRPGMAPAAGLPPLGGACHVYQVFSAQVTMPPPPWSRTHSVSRPPTVGPRAGLVAAGPSEAHTGVRRTSTTSRTVVFGCRPTSVERSRALLAQGPALAAGRPGQGVGVAGGGAGPVRPGWTSTTGGVAPRSASSWSKTVAPAHGAPGTSFHVVVGGVGGGRCRARLGAVMHGHPVSHAPPPGWDRRGPCRIPPRWPGGAVETPGCRHPSS